MADNAEIGKRKEIEAPCDTPIRDKRDVEHFSPNIVCCSLIER